MRQTGGGRTRSRVTMLSQYLSLMENSSVRDFLVEVDQALYRMQQSLDDSPSIENVLYQAELLLRDVIVVGSVMPAREEEVLVGGVFLQ